VRSGATTPAVRQPTATHGPTFVLGESTPDTCDLVGLDGIGQTVVLDLTTGTDSFRLPNLFGGGAGLACGKKEIGVVTAARGEIPPIEDEEFFLEWEVGGGHFGEAPGES
jgi:hypothetical protein